MNETSSSNPLGIQPKDVEKLESIILVCAVGHAAVLLLHSLTKAIRKYLNRGTLEYEIREPSSYQKLSGRREITVLLLSTVFSLYMVLKCYTWGCWIWIAIAFFIAIAKLFTEVQTIMMSLIPITTFLSHMSKSGWEWSEPVTAAVIRAIGRFVVLKEVVMIVLIILTYQFVPEHIMQVIYVYFGLHLSLQFLLLLPITLQVCPNRKPWKSMSYSEKMAFMQALNYFVCKLPILISVLYVVATRGSNHGMIFVFWIIFDIYILPICAHNLDHFVQAWTVLCWCMTFRKKNVKPIIYESLA